MDSLRVCYDAEMKRGLLSTLGLDASEEASTVQDRLTEEYGYGLAAVSRSLQLDAKALRQFDQTVKQSIVICQHGWPNIRKAEVRARLSKNDSTSPSFVDRAIDLGLRVWLMLDCCLDESTIFPKRWTDEKIGEFFGNRFDQGDNDEGEPISRFPRKFRAVNLQQLGNITVQWTSFLDEHLRFDEDNREVKIFNNKSWLAAMLKRPDGSVAGTLPEDLHGTNGSEKSASRCPEIGVPRQLILETIKTLDVLFPPWHMPTESFLEARNQDFHLLEPLPRDIPKLREFKFWRHRLLDLIVEYESPPLDWKHIWRDRRNPTAFWTFWIGIAIFLLTLIFGITASVLAGIQIELAEAALRSGDQ